MIWFNRSTYIFRVIVLNLVGYQPLTYIVATKHATERLLRALQVGGMKKIIQRNTLFYMSNMRSYLSYKMVVPIDVEKHPSSPSSLGHAPHLL